MLKMLIRLGEIKKQTGLSRSTIYAKISEGSFPQSVPLGDHSVAWIQDEVQTWIQDQIKKRRISCSTDYCYNVNGIKGLPQAGFTTAVAGAYKDKTAPYFMTGDTGGHGYIENTFQYNASLTMNKKTHSLKMGATLLRRQVGAPSQGSNSLTFSANYTGNALADMAEGLAVGVTESVTMVAQRFRMWEPSVYLQDDWRVTNALTLNLGVRYDLYTPWTERNGHLSNFDLNSKLIVSPSMLGDNESSPTGNIKTDFGDIAPRVGFAYSLPHSTVLRGGFGFSYFPGNSYGTNNAYQMPNTPFNWSLTCGATSYASTQCSSYDVAIASDGGYSLAKGLPRPTYDITLATNTANYAGLGTNNNYIMPNFKPSYLEQMNLQLQKQFGKNILTAGFVGSLGRRLPTKQNLNKPTSSTSAFPMYSASTDWMNKVYVFEAISGANSSWLAGEATYERRLTRGFGMSANYTWSRGQGPDSSGSECVLSGCPMDNGNGSTTAVKGWQQYNWQGATTHRVAGMLTYNIPTNQSWHGVLETITKGWSLNGTGYWQTGDWLTINSGVDQSGLSSYTPSGETPEERPNLVASTKVHNRTLSNWFNTSAFALQAVSTLGNAPRNVVQGPRARNFDLGLGKTFSMIENLKLQFRAEAFNVTNTPNITTNGGGGHGTLHISSYDSDTAGSLATSNSGFGAFNGLANDPRVFQFSLKLLY